MQPGDDLRTALGGNLCRCGCYVKIEEAVRRCAT
jgi:aerobic-type carbon monoxide dehydrogenase small subunit (CoxS/CutS family)